MAQNLDLGQTVTQFGTPQLFAIAVALVGGAFIVLVTIRRRKRALSASPRSVRDQYAELSGSREAAQDAEAVMVELDRVARQIQGRLDTQLAKLEHLIHDADARIERLSRLVRTADGEPVVDVWVKGDASGDAHPLEPDPRHAELIRLAEAGLSAADIARRTGQTTGEVELILSLRKIRRDLAQIPAFRNGSTR